ncbi:GINS complex Psf1 component [Mycena olivaceomarginata]|nr:GINS complex Psf1 component [Mycena olivaceomarginata]
MSFDDAYGTLAYDLVRRAKLSMELDQLLPYDGPLVRRIIQEQHDLDSKIRGMEVDGVTTSTHERWPALVILARVVQQNKRCLLAYHSHRLGVINTAYWQAGGAVVHVLTAHEANMSSDEVRYLRGFHDSVVEYRTASGTDILNLTSSLEDPPQSLVFITVETIVEPGPIYLESGLVDFKLGHRYFLVKEHIEHLLLQGYLRKV